MALPGLGGGGGWWEVRRASKDGTISGNPQHQRAGDLRALVINAITDVYFDRGAAPGWKRTEAVLRSNAYLEAGADCAFVIGVDEAADIGQLVRQINGPVNIVAGAAGLDVPGRAALGVKRISLAGGLARTAFRTLKDALEEVHNAGTWGFLPGGMAYPDRDKVFEPSVPRSGTSLRKRDDPLHQDRHCHRPDASWHQSDGPQVPDAVGRVHVPSATGIKIARIEYDGPGGKRGPAQHPGSRCRRHDQLRPLDDGEPARLLWRHKRVHPRTTPHERLAKHPRKRGALSHDDPGAAADVHAVPIEQDQAG